MSGDLLRRGGADLGGVVIWVPPIIRCIAEDAPGYAAHLKTVKKHLKA